MLGEGSLGVGGGAPGAADGRWQRHRDLGFVSNSFSTASPDRHRWELTLFARSIETSM
jgi:hypothetical protein